MISPIRSAILAATFFASLALGAEAQLPTGWIDQDIGACSLVGSATYDSSAAAFTVNGSGTGFGGTSDGFNFCYQSFTGNFILIARMTSNSASSGIMMRESLAPNAREQMMFSPSSAGPAWQWLRFTTGGTPTVEAGPTVGYPIWLKLQRYGDYLYKYYSPDGVNWTPLYGQDEALAGLSSTVYIGLAVSITHNNALAKGVFDNVSIQYPSTQPAIPGTVTTSWIGNTLPFGANANQMQYDVEGMYVAPDGTCYANAAALDLDRIWGVYKNGANLGFIPGVGYGGVAVTSDGTYLYIANALPSGLDPNGPPSGTSWYGFRRINKSAMTAAPFTGGSLTTGDMVVIGSKTTGVYSPGNVWGLTCNPTAQILYASDTLNGKIDLITTSTMIVGSAWTLPAGYAPYGLCWDATDNLLWVIIQNNNVSPATRQVWAYNSSGVQQTALTITGAVNPVSLALYGNQLYVADNGPDQNVKVYQSITTTPALLTTYGVTGGTFSGTGTTIGTTGNWRLNGMTAIGIDSSGNLYVSCNGYGPTMNENAQYAGPTGTNLESYNLNTSALNWRLQALEFFDAINLDPADETSAYGNETHYKLDWSQTTPGSQWSAVGNTLNYFKYPSDYREGASNTSSELTQVVRIGGQKFLALGNNYNLVFYRFNPATDGEGAIPCASFNVSTADPGHVGLAIWTDANGDGVRQLSETVYAGSYINPMMAAYIDPSGTIWTSNGATLLEFPCSLSSGGVPQYSYASKTTIAFSSLPGADKLTTVNRIVYDASADTMYLLGFSTNYPAPASNSGAGTVIQCITNWSGARALSWETVLPITATGNQQTSTVIEAMAGAGPYLFVQYQQGYRALVLNKSDGGTFGTLQPDPNVVGNMSPIWTDEAHAISAFLRSNGEYIITVEDDIFNKSIVYRWMAPLAPAITDGPPPASTEADAPYSFTFTTSGYPTPTFSLMSGSLPPGLTLSSAGVLSGTPTQAGAYSGVVVASNGVGTPVTQSFTITITSGAADTPAMPRWGLAILVVLLLISAGRYLPGPSTSRQ